MSFEDMIISKVIACPLCFDTLTGKYTPRNTPKNTGNMARVYWYCKNCKTSLNKTFKKSEEPIMWGDDIHGFKRE